jgi:hypothetical protein
MKRRRPLRGVWLGAICAGLAGLAGCGGGSSTTRPSTSLSCSLQVNAWDAPTPSGTDWNAFKNFILPNPAIHGVVINVPWNSVETSQGVYDPGLTALDNELQSYPGKKINLAFQPISYSNVNNPPGGVNTMTPSYVFTELWASSVGSLPLDVVTCPPYPGNGNPTSGYPVVYEKPFQVAYQNFIKAVLQHYKGSGIGYIRFGVSVGNEANPYCVDKLPVLPPAPDLNTTWENWVSTMDSYEKSVLPSPPIQLMQSLNRIDPNDISVPDFEAATAVANGFGFGNNGLRKTDITNSASGAPCSGDWCAMFDKYAGQVPLELQTATPSNPSGSDATNVTGNLADLIPVAVQHHATILEVLMPDLFLAFDPNYLPKNPADSAFSGTYSAAISNPCGQ